MQKKEPLTIVDLFAGPGGLGEGFSGYKDGKAFKILVSAEMETSAHATLTLRAFYRILKNKGGNSLDCYYRFCNGESTLPYDDSHESQAAWQEAKNEARQIKLGSEEGNSELNPILDSAAISSAKPWVLIGGPPCQAYSIVGRSRNRGKLNYKAEDDHRHYLYKEYLRIIQRYQPSVFVMENVKGILSSKVDGQGIFHTILRDLSNPDKALNEVSNGKKYRIHSLIVPESYTAGMDPEDVNANDFIIRAENYGIPQARHRVILLGIREDIHKYPKQLIAKPSINVQNVINDLPKLRSRLSKQQDSNEKWVNEISVHLDELLHEATHRDDLKEFISTLIGYRHKIKELSYGSVRAELQETVYKLNTELKGWYTDNRLQVWLNHETRGHMTSDLRRYLYASTYAMSYKRSPKGHKQFDLKGLRPHHENWESGKFSDRFRVQLQERPATTITSHISKDGHYFIHPDPAQCRSLTVREAARLQTFPDNYFFQGNRTQQFHQVGNAVPPMLAAKIAEVVSEVLLA